MKNYNELSAIESSKAFKLLKKEADEKIIYIERLLDPEELKPDNVYDDDLFFYEC